MIDCILMQNQTDLLIEINQELKDLRKDIKQLVTKEDLFEASDNLFYVLKKHDQELSVINFRLSRIEKRFAIY